MFAQHLASGKSSTESYVLAGYMKNDGNAARLKGNERISARVAELQKKLADELEITRESLTALLMEDRRLAHERGQGAAAGQISKTIGQLHGFAFDPIKEGGSVPLGQLRPSPLMLEDKSQDNVAEFAAIAARFGNGAK